MGSNKPISRTKNLLVQEHHKEILIYDLTDHRALHLNEIAAYVWNACDGTNSIEDIGRSIGSEDIVWLALAELERERLLDVESLSSNKFEGMSRRELITKIGLGTSIALPLIAAIVAPTAASAASCHPNDTACSTSAQCCSGCCKNVSPGANMCKPGGGACLP